MIVEPTKPQRHGRLGSRKSSNGCITCRVRKIKCDETQPSCHRCSRTGRKCDGYAEARVLALPKSAHLSQYGSCNDIEIETFQYFTQRILPGFSRIVDEEFWHMLVPQSSHSEPVVWYAVNALSSLIRASEASSGEGSQSLLALQWYNKSIQGLQQAISSQMQSLNSCYITCILFICIECVQGKIDEALAVYKRAVAIVEHGATNSTSVATGVKSADFVSLTIQKLLRHMSIALGIRIPRQPSEINYETAPVMEFPDLALAQDILYDLIADAHEFVCYTMELRMLQEKNWTPAVQLYLQREALETRLLSWRSAFDNTFAHLPSPPPYQQERYSVALLVHALYTIWLGTALSLHEAAYDAFLSTFQSMIIHAENVMESAPVEFRPLFTFETRLIPFLFFIATKCRHPLMRRQAVVLLRKGPKMENVVKAESMARIAEYVIDIEESGSLGGRPRPHTLTAMSLPSEEQRVYSAKLVEIMNASGQAVPHLCVGRWRHHSQTDEWSRIEDTILLESGCFTSAIDEFVAHSRIQGPSELASRSLKVECNVTQTSNDLFK